MKMRSAVAAFTLLAGALTALSMTAFAADDAADLDPGAFTAAQLPTDGDGSIKTQGAEMEEFGPPGFHPGFHPAPGPVFHPVPHPAPIFHPVPRPFPGPVFHPAPVYPWPHWEHPIFVRPVYPFVWENLRLVTCTAANNAGFTYPVTEDGYFGIAYQARMAQIEDSAIDRCFAETGGDPSCHLLGCNAGY